MLVSKRPLLTRDMHMFMHGRISEHQGRNGDDDDDNDSNSNSNCLLTLEGCLQDIVRQRTTNKNLVHLFLPFLGQRQSSAGSVL